MKKGYIIMAVFFLVFAGGIYGVFSQYVLPMQQELVKLEQEETKVVAKIQEMNTEFEGARPEEYLRALEAQKVPWREALRRRTDFFQLDEVDPIEMPDDDNIIPRFWYREIFPELEESVYQMARERNIQLQNFSFGEKRPEAFPTGTNPSREEILAEVNKYNYGIQRVKFIMDANPQMVTNVELWPEREAHSGRSGKVLLRTTGYEFTIMWDRLMQFLQRLSNSPTYITVDAIKITDRTLRDDRDAVTVELIITEAKYVPSQQGLADAEGGAAGAPLSPFGAGGMRLGGGFGRGANNDDEDKEEEESGGIINFFKGLIGL